MSIDYTARQRAALGAGEGICRALNPDRTFMCDLDECGHEAGDHSWHGPCLVHEDDRDGDCPCQTLADEGAGS